MPDSSNQLRSILVFGATGFVGRHVISALKSRGVQPKTAKAPRILEATPRQALVDGLADQMDSFEVIVNAAGMAKPGGITHELNYANAILPGILAAAANLVGSSMVHVSSAAVQGRKKTLDSSPETSPTSPYSLSKAKGESNVLTNTRRCIIYRPPGVHGPTRSTTQSLVRFARSRFAVAAKPGTANTPQALATNVGDAIAFLALHEGDAPRIVHHPSESLSTRLLLELLGGKPPLMAPAAMARLLTTVPQAALPRNSSLNGAVRRFEVLLQGQAQAPSWLEKAGWKARDGHDAWERLGAELATRGGSAS